jgi:hypothetical protein
VLPGKDQQGVLEPQAVQLVEPVVVELAQTHPRDDRAEGRVERFDLVPAVVRHGLVP